MNDMKKTMLDFVTFLQQQSHNLGNYKQSLQELKEQLQPLGNNDYEISQKIMDWYEQYPEIKALFNNTDWHQVRCDMVEENEEYPALDPTLNADRVTNKTIIQAIDQCLSHSEETSDRQNTTENGTNDH